MYNTKHHLVLTLLVVTCVTGAKLPDGITRCSVSSSDLKACLSKAIPAAIVSFRDGNQELGLPPLDPLRLPGMTIGEGGSGPVGVVQNFANLVIRGLAGATMEVTEVDFDKNLVVVHSITHRIEQLADYSMEGKVLVMPVRGSGKCNITLIRARTEHRLIGERYEKMGKTYFKAKEYLISMQPDRIYFHFENLFEGDERLGGELNKVMNENWREVYADAKAAYDKAYGVIFRGLANSLFSRVPFDDIFLP